ncbi:MAG: preprotein translocase subunit SecE [Bacilli bacterium]|nr:preprotein translocase subunit SecE [Bacilli bacterium]
MVGPIQYTREVAKEAKRVRWPKSRVLVTTIITVAVISIVFALILSLEDLAAGTLLQQLKSMFSGWSK